MGFGFSELVVLVIVAILVIGPKDMPKVLRQMGRWAAKARRMASEMRAQSGIDEILREGSIGEDLNEIRKLARGEIDQLQASVSSYTAPASTSDGTIARTAAPIASVPRGGSRYDEPATFDSPQEREREYPREGVDAYGALPDTAFAYASNLPPSKHARDPLYVVGDANAVLPEPAPAAPNEEMPEA